MREGGKARQVWLLAVVLGAVALLFAPTLKQGFLQWDDPVHLFENPHTNGLSAANIGAAFHAAVNNTYIPLTVLSFAVEHQIAGYRPFVYHLDNLLLHLGVTALVFLLALRLGCGPPGAAAAALLFGIHPMHVESVAWITERKDVLYGFFYLLALALYVRYIKTSGPWPYWGAAGCAVLSILAKPMALSLPLVLCVFDWYFKRPLSWRVIADKIPFAAALAPVAWITYSLNARTMDTAWPQALLTWVWSLAFYVSKFFLPVDLHFYYGLPKPVTLANPEFAGAFVVLLVVLLVLVKFRRNRLLLFAAVYFFVSIFFLLRFDDKKDLTFVADRFMYLPSVGLCVFLGYGLEQMWNGLRRTRSAAFCRAVAAAMVIVCSALAARTYVQVRQWDDEVLLWSSVLKRYPSEDAYGALAVVFFQRGQYAEAARMNSMAIRLNPGGAKAYINRGMDELKMGQYRQAIADYSTAIDGHDAHRMTVLTEDLRMAYNNRGLARWLAGDPAAALPDYAAALAMDPRYAAAYLNRAHTYRAMGNTRAAAEDFRRVLELDPANATAQRALAAQSAP